MGQEGKVLILPLVPNFLDRITSRVAYSRVFGVARGRRGPKLKGYLPGKSTGVFTKVVEGSTKSSIVNWKRGWKVGWSL